MLNEALFQEAKKEIFGPRPEDLESVTGYNIAVATYASLIEEAEAVRLGLAKPHAYYAVYLEKAFACPSDRLYPEPARKVLGQCRANFRARYQPLVDELTLKAA